jgi:hypothetical protein
MAVHLLKPACSRICTGSVEGFRESSYRVVVAVVVVVVMVVVVVVVVTMVVMVVEG